MSHGQECHLHGRCPRCLKRTTSPDRQGPVCPDCNGPLEFPELHPPHYGPLLPWEDDRYPTAEAAIGEVLA